MASIREGAGRSVALTFEIWRLAREHPKGHDMIRRGALKASLVTHLR